MSKSNLDVSSAPIHSLNQRGQSIWLDNLSKSLLDSGEFQRLVDVGVSGLTSNPSIFKKSIAESADYNTRISELGSNDANAESICEELFIDDVGRAADLLLPVYERTEGADGYASIEVSPFVAADSAATIEAGERLWNKLDRPNVMIKAPATIEGLGAIRSLLAKGINVNVTLIFSVSRYEKVIEAYISALEDRVKAGLKIDRLASVASFFVSRVDSSIESFFTDKKSPIPPNLMGTVGSANCALAYEAFQKAFTSPRFTALKAFGGMAQRPLWASTGVKNSAFPPLLYIEALAVKHTVNTVPPGTLEAILKGVNPTGSIETSAAEARALISSLAKEGIDFDRLLTNLEHDGVNLFSESYRALLDAVELRLREKL